MAKDSWDKNYNIKNEIKFSKEIFNIINFYLLNCPIMSNKTKVSQRATTFEEKKICGSSILSKFIRKMEANCFTEIAWEQYSDDNDIIIKSQNHSNKNEFIYFINDNDLGKVKSIFYYLRNSLAHGAFSLAKEGKYNVIYFECSRKGKIKARMKLYQITLLNWIKLFENFSN